MRMKLFVLALLILSIPSVKGQVYFPTPAQRPTWTLTDFFIFPEILKSITVRDSASYNESWYYRVDQVVFSGGVEIQSRELGYYRVEGSKVFVKERLDNISPEFLQYDFGLQPGDSVLIKGLTNFSDDQVLYRILARDTINCTGRNLLRLDVQFDVPVSPSSSGTYESRWVESIGDIYHPFLGFDCFDGTCESVYFRQKYISTLDSLSIEDYRECQVVSSVAPGYIQEPILLYPNPFIAAAQSSLKITFPDGTGRNLKKVIILDAGGREVKSFGQLSRRGVLQELEIDFQPGELSLGVHLLQLIDQSGNSRTLKWVVR